MDSENGGAFPASIEAVWGLRGRPPKGPRPGLTLEGIVAAAVRTADAEGLDAVSMSRVAKELGVSTMALYRYVATKDELVVLMADAAVGPPPPLPEGADWRKGLEHWASAMRTALLAHPWAAPLMVTTGPPATPNQLAWLDLALQALAGTGLPARAKLATELLVGGHVLSEVSVVLGMAAEQGPGPRWADYEPFLRRVTGDGRLPALRAAIEAGAFGDDEPGGAEEVHGTFAYGLARILDGVEAHLRTLRS
ncbi:hypothetical protein Misp01_21350 [Microtetraspora sp. NBRC 13810]|uniref:TetR/AcrR family transcriptional regulator n=1 Tax=Microtetraspora sp. NBRC 13810 TaxID=3030990 RepID=UPI0024A358A0|nr:TetR/AcrR family transcriptional regulator [Microtetraspora sp. NBRC 13810]GLW07005.1 hypothetical protein Misp01_21350 [Microtetraspora sp. NBRC 13810]